MLLVILANDELKKELLQQSANNLDVKIEWIDNQDGFFQFPDADGYINLLHNFDSKNRELFKAITRPVFVNSVCETLESFPNNFIRINGWNSFLKREIIEAAFKDDHLKKEAEAIFNSLGKKIEWMPDVPGFVSARVIAMIVNEAYLALYEAVSTREEIDAAMKLGTNYPYGPFEWSKQIGLRNIYELLKLLSEKQVRYTPATLLEKEAIS